MCMIWKTSDLKHTGINLLIGWKHCISSGSVTQTHMLHLFYFLPNQGVVSAPDSVRQDNLAEGFITIIVLSGNTEPHRQPDCCLQVLIPPRSGLAKRKCIRWPADTQTGNTFSVAPPKCSVLEMAAKNPPHIPWEDKTRCLGEKKKNKLVFRWTLP